MTGARDDVHDRAEVELHLLQLTHAARPTRSDAVARAEHLV
jgi:hypothetical protein